MQLDPLQIECCRAVWRSVPKEMKAINPDIASRVNIRENGTIIGIFSRDGMFEVESLGVVTVFENLNDAEDFAVRQLCRDEGCDHE